MADVQRDAELPAGGDVDLRELRQSRGLSLEALGYLAGVDQATISRIERGLAEPRRETVVRLARGLRIGAKRMAAIMAESRERIEQEGLVP